MNTLEDLLCSLITVVVRYHDRQTNSVKRVVPINGDILQPCRDYSYTLLQSDKCLETLKDIIDETVLLYPKKEHHLAYLLSQITFIKSLYDRTTPCDENILQEYIDQIALFYSDLRGLTTTIDPAKYKVTYCRLKSGPDDNTTLVIELHGLTGNAYFVQQLCALGLLIDSHIIPNFSLTAKNISKERLQELAGRVCNEFQYKLQVAECTNKINEQEIELAVLKRQIDELGKAQSSKGDEIAILKEQNKIAEATLTALKNEVEALKRRNQELTKSSLYPHGIIVSRFFNHLKSDTIALTPDAPLPQGPE